MGFDEILEHTREPGAMASEYRLHPDASVGFEKSAEVQKFWTERPGFKVAYDQLANAKAPKGGGGPLIGDYLGFRNVIESSIEAVLANGDVAKAQSKAQADATAVIKDYNKRIGA